MSDDPEDCTVNSPTPLVAKKSGKKAHAEGERRYSARAADVRDIIHKTMEAAAWDHVLARDLDPKIIEYVAKRLNAGKTPGDICGELGLNGHGGKNSKHWKKIAAYFRQGFRADAEAYLFQQTHKFYKVLEKAKDTLEDAFENGTPHFDSETSQVIRIKGATKELGSFLESYSKAIMLAPKLWKEFGAIGERKDHIPGQGTTIVVENLIPMPTVEQILTHQEQMKSRAAAIELKSGASFKVIEPEEVSVERKSKA